MLHPVWWDAIKSEVDKISSLSRKIEHAQIDINLLRANTISRPPAEVRTESISTDPIDRILDDIEGLRAIVRRNDLHNVRKKIVLLN